MPLAVYKGGLIVKDGKLCTSCCGGTPATGCCCRLKEDGSTDTVITTTSEECSAYISPQTDVVAVKFNPGKNCDDPDVECPETPPTSGICLYREDGKGTCTENGLNGDSDGIFYATKDEAQAAGDAYCEWEEAPECYKCRADVDQSVDDLYYFTITYIDTNLNYATGEYECIRDVYETTEIGCGGDPLHEAQWENNLPATHCKPVSSEEECTESTGVFCPNVTECPDDSSTGCPETPNRSNPLP